MNRPLSVPFIVLVTCLAVSVAASVARAQSGGWVKVTVAKANVRSEPNEKSPVLTQAALGALFELRAVEGDWFKVTLNMGGMRAEAYLSKKISTLVPAPAGTATPRAPAAAAAPVVPAPAPAGAEGMSVVFQAKGDTSWLAPHRARATPAADAKIDSMPAFAKSFGAAAASPSRSSMVVWVWSVDGPGAAQVIADRRPGFVVLYRDVPGISPEDLAPAIVRLAPSAADTRVAAAARGRADAATRADADWDVVKELRQDVVKSDLETTERGAVRLRPSGDLAPGEYAIVVRPAAKRKLSGATVLSEAGAGRVFSVVFDFAIK
jgi:hypothetical protein